MFDKIKSIFRKRKIFFKELFHSRVIHYRISVFRADIITFIRNDRENNFVHPIFHIGFIKFVKTVQCIFKRFHIEREIEFCNVAFGKIKFVVVGKSEEIIFCKSLYCAESISHGELIVCIVFEIIHEIAV